MQQKRHLEQKLARTQSLALLQLPPLSAHILALITEHGRLTISELEKLTQANRNTLKKHLRNLVQSSQLIMVGKGKGTAYRPTGR